MHLIPVLTSTTFTPIEHAHRLGSTDSTALTICATTTERVALSCTIQADCHCKGCSQAKAHDY